MFVTGEGLTDQGLVRHAQVDALIGVAASKAAFRQRLHWLSFNWIGSPALVDEGFELTIRE